LSIIRAAHPDATIAVTLDLNLPDIDGWTVLDRLKHELGTRHIPVEVITTDEDAERALRMGAVGVVRKPVKTKEVLDEALLRLSGMLSAPSRRLLVVDADEARRQASIELLDGADVSVRAVATGGEALAAIADERPDVIVACLDLPDMRGIELLGRLGEDASLSACPVVVFTPAPISASDQATLTRLGHTLVFKQVSSSERLFDETSLFLHRKVVNLSEDHRQLLEKLHRANAMLAGKKVLIVDDDIRNIFAMTTLLDELGMVTVSADTGRAAIDVLDTTADIDLMLMDIMMPEMDGYDTMRAIRKKASCQGLPIIAVTAKAMKGDREKCFDAGASDYLAKPVDRDQLISMLRVWLHR
jgi:CheY-like chemotaxis protein